MIEDTIEEASEDINEEDEEEIEEEEIIEEDVEDDTEDNIAELFCHKKIKIRYKESKDSKIWWYRDLEEEGPMEFSFDKKKVYNFWTDYPDKLTKEEKEIFEKEAPFWAHFKG